MHLKFLIESILAFVPITRRWLRSEFHYSPNSELTTTAKELIAAQPGSLVIVLIVLDQKIWILVISKNGNISRYESNIDRLTLGKKVIELRKHLETPNSDIKELQTTSKQLYDWLINPIEPAINASKTPPKFIFAPDRVTRYIPMGVLYDSQQYLTQRYPISTILSVGTTKIRKSTIGDIPNTKVLALGLSKQVEGYRALPAVPELASIVQTTGIYPGQILLDRDFTLSNLATNLKNKNKILHIATHGKF